jgi:hypothetical protein
MTWRQAPHPPAALKRPDARPVVAWPRWSSIGVSGTNSPWLEVGALETEDDEARSRSASTGERGSTWGTKPAGIWLGGGGRRQGRAAAAAATVGGVDGAAGGARGAGRQRVAGAALFQSCISNQSLFRSIPRLHHRALPRAIPRAVHPSTSSISGRHSTRLPVQRPSHPGKALAP